MKKTYINPEIEIIKIASQTQMLAGSAARFDDLGGGDLTLDPSTELDPGLSGDEVLSREFDLDF